MSTAPATVARLRTATTLTLLALTALPAAAQYKVVGPDGKVIYTDRPPAELPAQPLRRDGTASVPSAPALPLALRQPASRFPVVLYTTRECAPCDRGRQLLQQRGIPYREWQATAETDGTAWAKVAGTDQVPTLKVGQQVLSGFNFEVWNEYLTTAGYPTQSVLPAGYPAPAPQPLVSVRPAPAVAEPAPAPATTTQPPAPPPAPGGFRF